MSKKCTRNRSCDGCNLLKNCELILLDALHDKPCNDELRPFAMRRSAVRSLSSSERFEGINKIVHVKFLRGPLRVNNVSVEFLRIPYGGIHAAKAVGVPLNCFSFTAATRVRFPYATPPWRAIQILTFDEAQALLATEEKVFDSRRIEDHTAGLTTVINISFLISSRN